ncbi:MAG: WG repeat-containing protein [Clostridia bacterium]|nr:WG repeat-containing protein [Clostridia bacterium]
MKRKFIIRNILIILLVIAVIVGISYYYIHQNHKKYEIAKVEQYNYFVLKQENRTGVIDRNGNKVIEAEYEDIKIPNPEKAIFICYKEDETKVFNANKEEILKDYEAVEPIRLKNIASDLMYEKSVLKYGRDGKYGLINLEGKQITKPIYDEIDSLPYKEGELLVKQNNQYGVINIKGKKLIEIKYDQITVDGYYTDENGYEYAGYIISNRTEEGYRYGYRNDKGKLILKPEYNQLSRITEIRDNDNAYLLCAKNGQFGVMKNEKQLMDHQYQSITYEGTNQLFVVERSKRYGIANLYGEVIVPTQYHQIDITGIYLYAKNEQGTTVYNKNGTQANIDTNIAILNTSNDKYRIRINSESGTQYGVIGKDGKQMIEDKYSYLEYLYENYFIVSNENSKLGIIDDKEKVKIEIENDSLQRVENTEVVQAVMAGENLTKLYAKDMTKICEMKNANVKVQGDWIRIYNEEEIRYFNREGKELKNSEVYTNNVLFAKKENDKWGFADRNGNIMVACEYDKVTEFNEYGFAAIKKDGKWGVVNCSGRVVLEPTYELRGEAEPSFIGTYYEVKYGFGEVYYTDNK